MDSVINQDSLEILIMRQKALKVELDEVLSENDVIRFHFNNLKANCITLQASLESAREALNSVLCLATEGPEIVSKKRLIITIAKEASKALSCSPDEALVIWKKVRAVIEAARWWKETNDVWVNHEHGPLWFDAEVELRTSCRQAGADLDVVLIVLNEQKELEKS